MAGLVLDASVLIALYNDKDAHHKWAVDLMFQSPAEDFHMSSMNLAEVAVQPMRLGIETKFNDGIRGLNIKVSGLSQDAGFELARIRATTNVPMPDCCALQLVLEKDASLATCDKAQAKAAKALGIEVFQP
jgi:PIN domain nuclease of toxin-antitoxin system